MLTRKNKCEKCVTTKLYKNLRKNYGELIRHILGDDYYNMGMDVYSTDDLSCKDLIRAYDDLTKDVLAMRKAVWVMLGLIGVISWALICALLR